MISALAGLTMGLVGSVHCAAMCGGIAGAITAGGGAPSASARAVAGSAGRLASYAAAGALAGAFGSSLAAGAGEGGMLALRLAAALLLVGIGLSMGGWSAPMAWLERLGMRAWRRIAPSARRARASSHALAPFAFGVLWGWLPCGLVYSALAVSAASGSAADGALLMIGFGAGTLPATLAVALAAGGSARFAVARGARSVAAALMIAFGLWTTAATAVAYREAATSGSCHAQGPGSGALTNPDATR